MAALDMLRVLNDPGQAASRLSRAMRPITSGAGGKAAIPRSALLVIRGALPGKEPRPVIVSVQVIDVVFGMPAADVRVQLRQGESAEWLDLAQGRTDPDGRLELWRGPALRRGTYQLECDLGGFYSAVGCVSLFLRVITEFRLIAETEDLHVPLMISPNFVLAYRGSASPSSELDSLSEFDIDDRHAATSHTK